VLYSSIVDYDRLGDEMNWHYDGEVQIKKLEIQPFGTNCYIVICPQSGEGVIVDAPGEASRILKQVEDVRIKHIIITHTHFDHLGAFNEIRDKLQSPVAIHRLEAGALPATPHLILDDGDMVNFGTVSLRVLHTPGHTIGSLCLLTGKHLFSGDTLFPGGPGKTGTPAAFKQIVHSITEKIFILPNDTVVYPGHGEDTMLGTEKQEYAVFLSHARSPGLCGDVLWLSA
jgi:glyoxylase-like metal-dependent hydrolase (beta-lactamase superfamily II)